MKNKIYFYLGCLLFALASAVMQAQNLGISATGSAPSGDAGLDVNFSDKGVLIPRVSLTSLTSYAPITGGGPTESMLVYNTNATTGKGYYYWNGSRWVKLLVTGVPADAWLITGNAGTTAGTHFVGTTDNVSLVFKTNNTERMRILNTKEVIIGNASLVPPSTAGDVFTAYKNVAGVNWAVNGIATTGDGGGGWFGGTTISGYNVVESTNNYNGNSFNPAAVAGLALASSGAIGITGVRGAGNYSNFYGVRGSIPTTSPWLGYGGYFSGGLAYANGLYNVSDERLKKNIQPIKNALSKILSLKGISYSYNSEIIKSSEGDTRTYYGFIAQEVEKIIPEIVATKSIPISSVILDKRKVSEEEFMIGKTMDYVQIVPILVEAIKEQQKQIESLQAEIKKLKETK